MSELYKGRPTPPGKYFPYADLEPGVISVIKPLLKDSSAVAECHKTVDDIYPLYKYGHAALELLALDLEINEQQRISFVHGVTLYEVTASLVRPWAPKYSIATADKHIQYIKDLREDPELVTYEFADAFANLINDQEATAKMIADSVSHDTYLDRHFTLQGAAMARSLETGVIEDASITQTDTQG